MFFLGGGGRLEIEQYIEFGTYCIGNFKSHRGIFRQNLNPTSGSDARAPNINQLHLNKTAVIFEQIQKCYDILWKILS